MKKIFLLIVLVILFDNNIISQNKPTSQSNNTIDFDTFLSGVRFAEILLSEDNIKIMIENPNNNLLIPYKALLEYLHDMKFEDVDFIINNNVFSNKIKSECEIVKVFISSEISEDVNYKYTISLIFISCNGDKFEFKKDIKSNSELNSNPKDFFYHTFTSMYSFYKPEYNYINRLKLKQNEISNSWKEDNLKESWKINGIDQFEGIYEKPSSSLNSPRYKLGLLKTNDGYNLIYLSGAQNTVDWEEGELKANLIPTATLGLFKAKWYMANKVVNDEEYIVFEQGLMNVNSKDNKDAYIKMYPIINSKGSVSGTATGVALTTNGLIITNHHVIDKANSIKIKGIDGDFSKKYNAKVIVDDEKNDLAIIKIDDASFLSIKTPPYTIKSLISEVGSNIFVLGYPLPPIMGDEIKLTNGIISAKSGFMGDITCYQISAPLQPGNSGGPLFDKDGNLIGIVNAGYRRAENVGYAIKIKYLVSLIESLSPTPKLPTLNILKGKPLIEQVKLIKNFIYFIEVN